MKKLIALLMAGIMLFSFAACGGNGEEETTTNPEEITTEAPANAEGEEATDAEEVTDAEEATEAVTNEDGEEVTDKDGDVVTEKVTKEDKTEKPSKDETKKPTQAASKKPSTKAEVVEYFNKAVNGVKTGAKSIKQNYSKISLNGKTTLPSALDGILKILGGADKFIGGQLEAQSKVNPETYSGSDIKAKFPVEGESYASKLTAADVSSYSCTESNGVYTIKISTVADGKSTTVKHGEGHAPKAFNVVLPGIVNDNIPGIAVSMVGNASMNYPSSTATITVDVATGRVLTAVYDLKWTINFDKAGVIIPFTTLTSFDINW